MWPGRGAGRAPGGWSAVLARQRLDECDVVLGDETRPGEDRVGRGDAVADVVGQHLDRDRALKERLLVNPNDPDALKFFAVLKEWKDARKKV